MDGLQTSGETRNLFPVGGLIFGSFLAILLDLFLKGLVASQLYLEFFLEVHPLLGPPIVEVTNMRSHNWPLILLDLGHQTRDKMRNPQLV